MKLLNLLLLALIALFMPAAQAKDTQRAAGWNSRTTHQQPADTWSYNFQPAAQWCVPAGFQAVQLSSAAPGENVYSLGCDSQAVTCYDLARVVHFNLDAYSAAADPVLATTWNTCDDLANGRLDAKDATQLPTWLSAVHETCTA